MEAVGLPLMSAKEGFVRGMRTEDAEVREMSRFPSSLEERVGFRETGQGITCVGEKGRDESKHIVVSKTGRQGGCLVWLLRCCLGH